MPIHSINFNLPEERGEFKTTLNATNYSIAIYEFGRYLRDLMKQGCWPKGEPLSSEESVVVERVRSKFYEILSDNDAEDAG